MISLKIVNGFYFGISFIFFFSENSLAALYDIKPVNGVSSLEHEDMMMKILLEVKTEVSLLKKEIKDLNDGKGDEINTNNGDSSNKYERAVMQTLLELKNDVATQAKEIKDLKQKTQDSNKVAFMAQLSKTLENPAKDTVVKFDSVLTNVGDGYKPGRGAFVAPVNGTYAINLVATSSPKTTSEYIHLYIMHNVLQVGYIFLDQNSDRWLLRTTAIVVQLRAGDTVFVKIGNSNPKGHIVGTRFQTVFSGFLIN